MTLTSGTRLGPRENRPRLTRRTHHVDSAILFLLLMLAGPLQAYGQVAARPTTPSQPAVAEQALQMVSNLGPEYRKLQIWVGDWTYQGEDKETAFQSQRRYAGRATVRPVFGGAFVEWQAEEANGGSPAREIDGYDPTTKRFFFHAYYPNGSVEMMTYTIEGNMVTLSGTTDIDGKRARLKGTCVFAPDSSSFVEKLQVCLDGKTWIPMSEVKFAKVK